MKEPFLVLAVTALLASCLPGQAAGTNTNWWALVEGPELPSFAVGQHSLPAVARIWLRAYLYRMIATKGIGAGLGGEMATGIDAGTLPSGLSQLRVVSIRDFKRKFLVAGLPSSFGVWEEVWTEVFADYGNALWYSPRQGTILSARKLRLEERLARDGLTRETRQALADYYRAVAVALHRRTRFAPAAGRSGR